MLRYVFQDPRYRKELLPVLVFFYGGAFIEGNSSTSMFGPEFLLDEDVVVVTPNYRIGLFGKYSYKNISDYGTLGVTEF